MLGGRLNRITASLIRRIRAKLAQGDKMTIRCVCMNAIDVNLLDFGTTYVSCQKCGREYEINSEFSLAVDVDDEDCASTEQANQPDSGK
jgi:hypothetical protein